MDRRPGASVPIASMEYSGASTRLTRASAAESAGRPGIGLGALEGDGAGPDEAVGRVFVAREFGQDRLADGPPGVLSVAGRNSPRRLRMRARSPSWVKALWRISKRARRASRAASGRSAEPRHQFSCSPSRAADFFERVGGRRVEDGGGGLGVEGGRQEPVEVEEIGFVRLARGPEAWCRRGAGR